MIGQFSLYRCKGMSGTAAQSGIEIVLKKIGHEQSGGQMVKSQEIGVFIMLSCWISSSNWIISVDKIVHRHLFFANPIFKFIIRDN